MGDVFKSFLDAEAPMSGSLCLVRGCHLAFHQNIGHLVPTRRAHLFAVEVEHGIVDLSTEKAPCVMFEKDDLVLMGEDRQ